MLKRNTILTHLVRSAYFTTWWQLKVPLVIYNKCKIKVTFMESNIIKQIFKLNDPAAYRFLGWNVNNKSISKVCQII